MKLEQLVGAVVARTKPLVRETGGYFSAPSKIEDTSYTREPLKVEAVVDGLVYIRDKQSGPVRLLSAAFNDENWAAVAPEYLDALWPSMKTDSESNKGESNG